MCEENRTALEGIDTKADAIELYKKTIDWALEEGYPTLETLRQDFSDCEEFGIYVGRRFHGEILNREQVYVFHNCTGTIRTGMNLNKRIIPMLYFANGCDMSVKGIGDRNMQIRVPLYVFGENRVVGEKSDDIICKIYEYEVK